MTMVNAPLRFDPRKKKKDSISSHSRGQEQADALD